MKNELKKIFSTRWAVLLMLAAVLINGVLFYRRCAVADADSGYSLAQVGQKYASLDTLAAEAEALQARLAGDFMYDSSLLTGNIQSEYALDLQVLARAEAARGYRDSVEGLIAENRMKINTGFFGGESAPAVRIMRQSIDVYRPLLGLDVPVAFSGGVEAPAGFHVTELLLLIFAAIPSLVLLTYERARGLELLTRPMKNGRLRLWLWKLGAAAVTAAVGFLLMHGTNIAISAATLGLGDLLRPIQSVYGYELCPRPLTVLGFLLELYGRRFFWLLTVSCSLFALGSVFSRPTGMCACAGAAAVAAFALRSSGDLWLRSLSLSTVAQAEAYFQRYILLDLSGALVPEDAVGLALCGLLTALSLFLGAVAFCKRSAVAPKRSPRLPHLRLIPAPRHTNLTLHECHKLFITQGAALVLALFALLQLIEYRDLPILRGAWETYYAGYSQILQGPPTDEKAAWLEELDAKFSSLERELSQTTDTEQKNELQRQLFPRAAFNYAKAQYEDLSDGQWYLYRTGFERLFGRDGLREDLMDTVKLMFVLALCLAGLSAREYESGVRIVQTSCGSLKRVAVRKAALALAVVLLGVLTAYLPRYIAVTAGYGALALAAPAVSVSAFASLPSGVTVGITLAIIWAIRLAAASLAALAVALISKSSKSTVTTTLTSLLTVCFPFAVAAILA